MSAQDPVVSLHHSREPCLRTRRELSPEIGIHDEHIGLVDRYEPTKRPIKLAIDPVNYVLNIAREQSRRVRLEPRVRFHPRRMHEMMESDNRLQTVGLARAQHRRVIVQCRLVKFPSTRRPESRPL